MLEGNLSDLPLPSLLQSLAPGKGGLLSIEAPGLKAQVGLSSGRVVYAQAGPLGGPEALALLVGLPRGKFRFQPGEVPPVTNVEGSLEAVLTRLIGALDAWLKLKHLPPDWSYRLATGARHGEIELTLDELKAFTEMEGKRVAEALLGEGVLARARLLDRLLELGALAAVPAVEVAPEELVALPIYGKDETLAYIDEALYRQWAEALGGAFQLEVTSPRGAQASFKAAPRREVAGRVLINDRALRRLRAGRGTRLKVKPKR